MRPLQPFHTDMCDILSMYVLDTAVSGGESLLASSATVYNEIAATRPDLIHLLADNKWIHDEYVTTTDRPPITQRTPCLPPKLVCSQVQNKKLITVLQIP